MAIFIEACFSKKIGLPQFSSAGYSVTLRTEVSALGGVERESAQLYELLKNCVDRELQDVGHIPDATGNGHGSDRPSNGQSNHSNGDQWACSPKQRDLVLKIVDEHKIPKQDVETLSKEMFNAPVKTLNKMDASSLIAELIAKYGPTKANGGNGNGRRQYQRGGAR